MSSFLGDVSGTKLKKTGSFNDAQDKFKARTNL